jgi:hypothetical protein
VDYRHHISAIVENYQHGSYAAAASEAGNAAIHAEKDDKRDQLALLLEAGATERSANYIPMSTQAFDHADTLFNYYDEQAKTRISKETTAAFLNQAALDYEGTGYDRIMTNVYKALNYLDQGDKDNARIEIHRIADSQRKDEERWSNQLRQSQQAAKENNADAQRAQADPHVQQQTSGLLSDFNDPEDQDALRNLSPKAVYDNPYAEYLQGLFYLYSDDAGDREVGRVALRNAAGMMQSNQYAVADAHMGDRVADGGSLPARTYVLFETGMAPTRVAVQIYIPVYIRGANMITVAFPALKKIRTDVRSLTASTSSGSYQTQMLADMDSIVAREFKNELPTIITRAVISATLKAAMTYGADQAAANSGWEASVATQVSMLLYQGLTNEADTRTWRTLPKWVELASFDTPADGNVSLQPEGGPPGQSVHVNPGHSAFIWVRCPSEFASPVVRVFQLN